MKIGIIGTGSVASNNYIPYLSEQEDVELFYCSRTPAKAEVCAGRYGGRVCSSVESLMAQKPDTVMILTNESEHASVAERVLKCCPPRIFFEKPLFAKYGQARVCEEDFLEARSFLCRARKLGVETAMNFNYRFFDQSRTFLKLRAERKLGKLLQCSLFVNYACWSHCIDLMNFFGLHPLCVSAQESADTFSGAADIAAALRFSNGAAGTILGTNASSFSHPLYRNIFVFENGMICQNDLDAETEVYAKEEDGYKEKRCLTADHSRWDRYAESFRKSLCAYLESLRSGQAPPVSGLDGLRELRFEAALRRSAALGRCVRIEEEFPLECP